MGALVLLLKRCISTGTNGVLVTALMPSDREIQTGIKRASKNGCDNKDL